MENQDPLPSDWQRSILCLYYETIDGEIVGFGNAGIIAAFGDKALAVTANHNATYTSRVAARESPFRDLLTAREANPRFQSRVKGVIGERRCNDVADVVDVPTFRSPVGEDSDVALAYVHKRASSPYDLNHAFGLRLVPPEIGETVFVMGSHSHELVDVQPLNRGHQWKHDGRIPSGEGHLPFRSFSPVTRTALRD